MALVMFLFGSALGLTGAITQLALGFDALVSLNTYTFFSVGLPMVTLLAMRANNRALNAKSFSRARGGRTY